MDPGTVDASFWRLTAGLLAGVLAAISVVAYLRFPRPLMLIVLGLLVLIPAAGFAAYALLPGPVPTFGPLLWLGFVPALIGLAAGIWMLAYASRRRSALTFSNLQLLSNGTLVAYAGLVIAMSDVLALWQPPYAVANLAVSAIWALAWVPRRWRESKVGALVEIRAPVSRVYSFLADPENWPRYQEGMESAVVRPPGPLAPGSVVITRLRYDSHVRGPRMLPGVIESEAVVTDLVPNTRIVTEPVNRPGSWSGIELEPDAAGGTSMLVHSRSVAPYRLAVFGALVELRTQAPQRKARALRSLAKLKQLLEEPVA